MKNALILLLISACLCNCTASRNYNPSKKFSKEQLIEDYTYFRNILEESHPGLYWYTSRDSMNYYFEQGASKITDSLMEFQFRNVLSYVTSKLRCGHTSIRASEAATRFAERSRSFALPLSIKAWPDTALVSFNLNRKDSNVVRGVILKSIDGHPINNIIDSLFSHLSGDGFNTTHKYQVISNGGNFRNMYGSIFGLRRKMNVEYVDLRGNVRSDTLAVYNPLADTPVVRQTPVKISRSERKKRELAATRNLQIDTARSLAIMEVNAFQRGQKLRKFFRQSFKQIKKMGIRHLAVDLRGNGGGSVVLSNLLTKYIAAGPFKIADSIYSIRSKSSYHSLINNYLSLRLFHLFMTKKKADGNYHFGYYENRFFKPKTKNHFDGNIFVLTGGNTFSAASLVAKALKGQKNVSIVGEETGGGAYGNTAWMIPDVTLPNTKVRFRLPLFRLVIDKNEKKGNGVVPDVEVLPTVDAIRRNEDFKMKKVFELIKEK
jgi:hypothetical protein